MLTATRYDFTQALNLYKETITPLYEQYLNSDNAGGKMRATVGDLYETIAQSIIYTVDPTIVCKHNDYILIESKGGKYFKRTQVDIHCYKDGELLCIIEGKTYVDSSMLDRACSEFDKIRRAYPGIPAAVFSGQNAVNEESMNWFKDETDFETFFINVTKQRRSDAPIFQTCDPLDVTVLQQFAEWIQQCLDNH